MNNNQVNPAIMEACRLLAVSTMRREALRRKLDAANPVLHAEERLCERRQLELRAALKEHGWGVDILALTAEVAGLPTEPKTREEAVEALALSLLYQALVD